MMGRVSHHPGGDVPAQKFCASPLPGSCIVLAEDHQMIYLSEDTDSPESPEEQYRRRMVQLLARLAAENRTFN